MDLNLFQLNVSTDFGTSRAAVHGGSAGIEHAAEGPLLFASEQDQIAFWRSQICTGAHRNPAASGTHQGK